MLQLDHFLSRIPVYNQTNNTQHANISIKTQIKIQITETCKTLQSTNEEKQTEDKQLQTGTASFNKACYIGTQDLYHLTDYNIEEHNLQWNKLFR